MEKYSGKSAIRRPSRLLLMLVAIVIAFYVITWLMVYKREEGYNSLKGYERIGDVTYSLCYDKTAYCKYDGLDKVVIFNTEENVDIRHSGDKIFKMVNYENDDSFSYEIIKYDSDGNMLDSLLNYYDITDISHQFSHIDYTITEDYIFSLMRQSSTTPNRYFYTLSIIDLNTMSDAGDIEFEYDKFLYFYGRFFSSDKGVDYDVYSVVDNELTMYLATHSTVFSFSYNISDFEYIGNRELLDGMSNSRDFVINNNFYTVPKSSPNSVNAIVKYDMEFNVVDQIDLGKYHVSSRYGSKIVTSRLSSNKKKTYVKLYDENFKLYEEYTLGLWCSNVVMINDEYAECVRTTNHGILKELGAAFAMSSRAPNNETIVIRLEEYKIN